MKQPLKAEGNRPFRARPAPSVKFFEWRARSKQAVAALLVNSARSRRNATSAEDGKGGLSLLHLPPNGRIWITRFELSLSQRSHYVWPPFRTRRRDKDTAIAGLNCKDSLIQSDAPNYVLSQLIYEVCAPVLGGEREHHIVPATFSVSQHVMLG